MLYHNIGGTAVPALGLGTYQLTGAACTEGVADALALGYRHVDTAAMYGNEAEVGAGLRQSGVPRADVFLTTKVWIDRLDAAGVRRSTHRSLDALGVDYLDLLLIHWPSPTVPLEETLGAMFALRRAGSVRHVGVSNFPPALLEKACALGPIFANQVEYHPYLNQDALLEACRAQGVLLTAYTPLAKGRVTTDPAIGVIARRHGKTPAQVTLRWLVQRGVAAIPKARTPAHRRANLDIFDFALSADEMAEMGALARGLRTATPSFAPDWG